MWVLGVIVAAVATSLILMFIKGGMRLVSAVVGAVVDAVVSAVGLVLSGVILVLGWVLVKLILLTKFVYKKLTTKPTDVDEFTTWKWMKDAELPRD